MVIPQLLIIADRGNIKAYRVEAVPGRGATAHLLESHRIEEAHGRYQDKFSDQAGSFPNGGTNGAANSIAERMTLDAEIQMRCFREAASLIMKILATYQPERWAFAAPSEINGAILDGLPSKMQQKLVQNVPKDILKIESNKLLNYFAG